MEPVPAMAITPEPVPKAASSAISVSPTTSIDAGVNSERMRWILPATSGRAAPAAPMQMLPMRSGLILAAAQTSRTEACNASRACASPTRIMLLPPATAVASVVVSSPSAQRVLVPPPSIPR